MTNNRTRTGYLWGDDAKAFAPGVAGLGKTNTPNVTLTGLAYQKYTFCVKASTGTHESSIAKLTVTPMKYTAPKVTKPATGATTLTWEPVKSGQTVTYVVGVYDSKTKAFDTSKIIDSAVSDVTDISKLGTGKIGVQELLWDGGNLIAKSAIKVITVK